MHQEFFISDNKNEDFFSFPVEKKYKKTAEISSPYASSLCGDERALLWQSLLLLAVVGEGRLPLAKVLLQFLVYFSLQQYFQSWLCPKEKITDKCTGAWIYIC